MPELLLGSKSLPEGWLALFHSDCCSVISRSHMLTVFSVIARESSHRYLITPALWYINRHALANRVLINMFILDSHFSRLYFSHQLCVRWKQIPHAQFRQPFHCRRTTGDRVSRPCTAARRNSAECNVIRHLLMLIETSSSLFRCWSSHCFHFGSWLIVAPTSTVQWDIFRWAYTWCQMIAEISRN